MEFESLLSPISVQRMVKSWLTEDLPSFDVGGFVVGDNATSANLLCKQTCVLAGAPFFNAVFEMLDCSVEWLLPEGAFVDAVPQIVAVVRGSARKLLLGERPALNCMSRASGIASQTAKLARLLKDAKWGGRLAATRKTTPGFRLVEKYAVLIGGGDTHRYDLSSMVMLKDNHITECNGNVAEAISKARLAIGFSVKLEVEARNAKEAHEAAFNKADVVMLDNFLPEEAKRTAGKLKTDFPNVLVEISGGINESNLVEYASPDIDLISMGKLTQGYPCIDYSLKLNKRNVDGVS